MWVSEGDEGVREMKTEPDGEKERWRKRERKIVKQNRKIVRQRNKSRRTEDWRREERIKRERYRLGKRDFGTKQMGVNCEL